jgi:hypothetical protein
MIAVEYILLLNTGVFSIFLLVLLFLSGRKNPESEKGKEYLTAALRKIKDQVEE